MKSHSKKEKEQMGKKMPMKPMMEDDKKKPSPKKK